MAISGVWRLTWASALGVLLAPFLGGCSSGGRVSYQAGVDRATPEKTYEFFKNAARNHAFADEWSVFSPNFKRQMNEAAGRDVDFATYAIGRNTVASNNQADMALLLNSRLDGVQMLGPDAAVVTVTGGGRTIRPRMVRLTSWELRVKGDADPFTDVIQGGGVVRPGPDGALLVSVPAASWMASQLRAIPPQNIESLEVERRWYVDDFGGLESSIGGAAEPAPKGTPTPTAPANPPPPKGGYGSPDG